MKIKKPDNLIIFKPKFAVQNAVKEKRIAELIIANKELIFKNKVHEKCATELIIANKKLISKKEVKEKRAAELVIANKELIFQNKEKEKRAAELVIANKELAFQNKEKEKREAELVIANKELAFQNKEKEKRAAELVITNKELKKTEEAIRDSLRKFSDYKYALDESSIVAITDQKGIIIDVNENFCKISKYAAKELVGQDHRIVNSGYHPKSFIKKLWSTIASGKIWLGDLRNRAKDGSIYWVDTTIVPFLNDKGKPFQYMAIRADITERKNTEEKLKASEDKYRSFFDQSADAIFIFNESGHFLDVNIVSAKLLGYTRSEFMNMSLSDILFKEDLTENPIRLNLLAEGKSVIHQRRFKRKDGSVAVVEVHSKKLPDGRYLGVGRDITERIKTEELLFNSQKNYKKLLENMNDGFLADDISGKVTFVNKRFLEIFGLTEDDTNDLVIEDYVSPDYAEMLRDRHNRRIAGKKVADVFVFKGLRKNGEKIWLEVRVNQVIENGMITGTQSVISDITERKKAEEEIRKRNEQYEFVNKATQDITWEWDYRTHKGKWGERIMTTFGYSEDKLNYSETWIDEFVHPDDKEQLLKDIQDRIENSLQNCQNEYRFRCADGSYKYVFDRGYILYDENKKPYRMIGAMTDMTEKKRLEKELAEQQINQQKLITETIIQTQEKERHELGRELHDNINQILATVKMYLGMAKAKENVSVDLVGQSYEYVTEAIVEIRKLSHSLVASSLGDIGLEEALQVLVENTNLLNNLQVQFSFDEKYYEKEFDKNKELMFYRIVQEQMNNITKYAKANKVVVTLNIDDDILFLSVADDGVGFDVTQKSKGIGLKNISSRVEFYSGNMNIISAPGQGCTLEVFIPC